MEFYYIVLLTVNSFSGASTIQINEWIYSLWSVIYSWILIKIEKIPPFALQDIVFFKGELNSIVFDDVNLVLLLGKYHIHICKWRKCKLFNLFLCDFRKLFKSFNYFKKQNRKTLFYHKFLSLSHYCLFVLQLSVQNPAPLHFVLY